MDNHHIPLVIFLIFFSISVVNASDEVKNAFGSFLDEAKEALGPASTWDLDKVKDTFGPSVEEAKEALGPISSFDQVKEALSPLSSSILDEPISPSTKSKASKHIDSVTSWLSQNELPPTPSSSLQKEEMSSDSFEEAQKELGPISSSDLDKDEQDASTPVSTDNEAQDSQNKEEIFSDSPSNLDEAQNELGPISFDDDLDKGEEDASTPPVVSPSTSNDAKEKLGKIRFLLSQNKEKVSPSILEEGPISSSDDLDKDASSPVEEPEEDTSSDSPSILDEAQEGPTSSDDDDDLNKDEDASSPIDESEEAFAPVSPSNSNEASDDVKEIFGPITSENKEEIFSDSPSILDEAQKELGPISSSDLDKDEDASSPVPPSDFKEEEEAIGSISSQAFNVAKEKLGSIRSLLSQNKEEKSSDSPSNLDEAQEEVGPISSSDDLDKAVSSLDEDEEAVSPVSSSISNEAKEALGSISSEALDGSFGPIISQKKQEISSSILEEAQKEVGPISSFDLDKDEEEAFSSVSPSTTADEAEGSVSSEAALNEKIRSEEISSDSSSLGPISSFEDEDIVSPISSLDEEKDSISGEALKQNFGPISAAKMKVEIGASKSSIYPIYFDHDVALAIESLIKQGQSNSRLAIEEAEKLLSDAGVASSEKGKCVKKCKNDYASCVDNLQKAMEDLRGRNAELLTDDVNAVETDISACQNCFLENTQNQSPLKDLEEATIKATRECLNVLHHSI